MVMMGFVSGFSGMGRREAVFEPPQSLVQKKIIEIAEHSEREIAETLHKKIAPVVVEGAARALTIEDDRKSVKQTAYCMKRAREVALQRARASRSVEERQAYRAAAKHFQALRDQTPSLRDIRRMREQQNSRA